MDELEHLPPDHMPVDELIRWLAQRLGRRPTYAELAELRFAMAVRTHKRRRREQIKPRGRKQAIKDYVREFLSSHEGKALLGALSILPSMALSIAAADSMRLIELRTRRAEVLRAAKATEDAAKAYPLLGCGSVVRRKRSDVVRAVVGYLRYKLAGGRKMLGGEARPGWGVDPEILAAINAADISTVRGWLGRLEARGGDFSVRTALEDMRRRGEIVVQQFPALGAPLEGALAEPQPDLDPEPESGPAPTAPKR